MAEFPYEEIRTESGDYFSTINEANAAGYDDNQIWSVCESDGCYTYGPPFHWVNRLGFVATKERHDHNTYYDEQVTTEDEDPATTIVVVGDPFSSEPAAIQAYKANVVVWQANWFQGYFQRQFERAVGGC